jgi:hypothetical protein
MRAVGLLLAAGLLVPLDVTSIQEALTLANSAVQSTHQRFHADYHIAVNRAPVDFISIVSPFRRVVLAAESEARLGRRMFGQREAIKALQPEPETLEVFVELTFHPHNTLLGVPGYDVELEPALSGAAALLPREVERLPRFGPRLVGDRYPFPYPYRGVPQAPSGSEPLRGGTLIARFDGDRVDTRGLYGVVIRDGRQEIARARVDLLRLR